MSSPNHAIVELIPDKAMYRPGEPVRLLVRGASGEPLAGWAYEYAVLELIEERARGRGVTCDDAVVELGSFAARSAGYGVFMTLTSPDGRTATAETAFDTGEHWREAPRYGFLSDFAPDEAGRLDDVEFARKRHLNFIQFYDWMYRHDRLLPDAEPFVDPLGRRISHNVVREKINALRERGIASIAYAAVYGALPDYIERHPEQGLYQNNGKTHSLGNFFHIMDISADSDWTAHIIEQFVAAISAMGFDGLHLDQYGLPKKAIRHPSRGGDVVDLRELYPAFVDLVRERLPNAGLIFNNVSGFPVAATAQARQDVMYIEVWDPATHLRDLKTTIDWARKLSGKHVVLAAYLPAFHPERQPDLPSAETGATLAMAAIFASGGYHLLLGEHGNVLADSYYPKYGTVSDRFAGTLARYYDFIVMYRELLFDHALDDISMTHTGGINTEIVFAKEGAAFTPNGGPDAVWTIVKEKPGYLVLHLINLCGVDNDVWHAGKTRRPKTLFDIEVKVEVWEAIEDIFLATPDGDSIRPEALAYEWTSKGESAGDYVRFTLPRLDYWSMIVIRVRAGQPAPPPDLR
ncbi:glycoside hydrolase family 66 protein [Paenibacillaceae bacterium WGS1546]|uniref:glycoside hydrolase family 66 protein n=1 Tax=Cohnella sp. WGS1546 TaxID=3366810 RepID=UPI00372D5DD4